MKSLPSWNTLLSGENRKTNKQNTNKCITCQVMISSMENKRLMKKWSARQSCDFMLMVWDDFCDYIWAVRLREQAMWMSLGRRILGRENNKCKGPGAEDACYGSWRKMLSWSSLSGFISEGEDQVEKEKGMIDKYGLWGSRRVCDLEPRL